MGVYLDITEPVVVEMLSHKVPWVIAGSYPLSLLCAALKPQNKFEPGDIDVFVPFAKWGSTGEQVLGQNGYKHLKDQCPESSGGGFQSHVWGLDGSLNVNVVHLHHKWEDVSISSILSDFDLTICQVALCSFNGVIDLKSTAKFKEDFEESRTRLGYIKNAYKTKERVDKYAERGFPLIETDMLTLLKWMSPLAYDGPLPKANDVTELWQPPPIPDEIKGLTKLW